jgi:hypothetical protein
MTRTSCFSLLLLALVGLPASAAGPSREQVEFFEKKVRPVLVEHCYNCHSAQAKKKRGGLLLDSRAGLLKGGDTGPAVVPGKPEQSRLIEAVGYRNVDLQMPPRKKLPAQAIADLTAWVRMRAPWPAGATPAPGVRTERAFDLEGRKKTHWAWQPVLPRTPPLVRDAGWARGTVDRFILAHIEAKGLRPAPAADRLTLLRRLSFDLIGLPPAPVDIDAFERDSRPDAYERLVDRLLASPHFGERWGRHWLDLVRYAETRGHEFDYPVPNAHHYRDYVIRALNADLPYDRFVSEHVAGDLLPPRLHPRDGFNESLLGTGFWFFGEELHSPVDVRADQADRFDNRIDVFGKTFLGLTIACARCHDHKFDAISTKDYYALFGFLASSNYRQVRFDSLLHNRGVASELWRMRDRTRPGIEKALAGCLRPGVERSADYLLAAREAILGRADSRKLEPARLERWVAAVRKVAKDRDDPLHAWALLACAESDKPEAVEKVLAPVREVNRRQESAAAGSRKDVQIVADYTRSGQAAWLPDDVTFGPGPVPAGRLQVSGESSRPVVRLAERGAACFDPFWKGLELAPGTENEPGALGRMVRAGRTISTPAFKLTTGKLWYLVRGTGMVYTAVGNHVMIAGPLHGRLVQHMPASSRYRWFAHDLSPYRGLTTHIEFTAGDADFAIAQVVQGDRPPALVDAPLSPLDKLVDEARSLDGLAKGYRQLLLDTLKMLETGKIETGACAAHQARLVNWMLQQGALFGVDETRIAEAVRPYFEGQQRLASKVQRRSRLAPAIQDGSSIDEHVFVRGSHKTLGPVAPRRFLEALAGPTPLKCGSGSGRLELAEQLTDVRRNPLLARVLVNRVWHHLFGRGIVASVDDMGVMGQPPTHPELLDYLADRFVTDGWSIKRLIRELVLSATYRMSSVRGGAGDPVDPENLLLRRMRLRRLEGEAIRDAMLTVSGRLDKRMFGRPVPVYLTAFQDGRGRPASGPLDGAGRRSVYLGVRRNFLSSLLLAFDTPAPFSTVGRRTVSNVPAQSLILMNDPFVHQQAGLWARRVLARTETTEERLTSMYRAAFGRAPTPDEYRACQQFLGDAATSVEAWTDLAHALFNVKEFIFLP